MELDFEKLILRHCEIPPMPQVAAKAVEMLNHEDVSAGELSDIISKDSALATRVLNMANSAFYRRLEEIRELRSAIVILGLRTIRGLVLGASLKQLFKSSSLFDNMLWQHSIAAAIAAALFAKETNCHQSDEVMLAGLLHDVGKNILHNSLPKRYQGVIERCYQEGRSYHEVELEVFGFAHHQVGPILVKSWNFPMDLGKAIYYHHAMEEIGAMEENTKKLVALVHLANLFCRRLGLGYREPNPAIPIVGAPSLAILGLDLNEEGVAAYEGKIAQAFEEDKGRFD
jgi:putative nucleotidyltransferase with HDIG domain